MERLNIITGVNPISFRQCITEEDVKFCLQMRHKIYCEDLEFISTNEIGEESDEHDTSALHYIIENNGVAIGCFRLVLDCTTHIASMIENKGVYEISRFIIEPKHRSPQMLTDAILSMRTMMVSSGLTPACMTMMPAFARFLKSRGISIEPKSEYFMLNGKRRVYQYKD
jgi:N-acyl-L-homoserine lactone synthetase